MTHADRETVPPRAHADHAAEAGVLGTCLLDDDALAIVAGILDAEDFDLPAHATIYEALGRLDAGDGVVDSTTLAMHLQREGKLAAVGGTQRLAELMSAGGSSAHVAQHARALNELSRLRHAARLARSAGHAKSPREVAAVAERMLEAVEDPTTSGPRRISDCIDRAFVRVEEAAKRGSRLVGVSCGYRELDAFTGGYRPGQLILIAGRPGDGKSSLGLAQARAMARSGTVLFVSLEMPEAEVTDRLLASEARVSNERFLSGRLTSEDLEALSAAAARLDTLPLLIDDTASLTLAQIAARARTVQRAAAAEGKPLVALFVDYLGLIEGDGWSESRERETGKLSRGLKALAKRLGVPIIALAQLNREVTKRGGDSRPKPADLRDSGSLEQDADIILLIYQEPVEEGQQRPARNTAEIILAKHRGGRTGMVPVMFDGATTTFFATVKEAA